MLSEIQSSGTILPLEWPVLTAIADWLASDDFENVVDDPTIQLGYDLHVQELRCVKYFLEGFNYNEIAKLVGISIPTVKRVLLTEEAQELIYNEKANFNMQLEGLRGMSIEVMRDGMRSGNRQADRNASAKLYLQVVGDLNSQKGETAEDHAQQIYINIENNR